MQKSHLLYLSPRFKMCTEASVGLNALIYLACWSLLSLLSVSTVAPCFILCHSWLMLSGDSNEILLSESQNSRHTQCFCRGLISCIESSIITGSPSMIRHQIQIQIQIWDLPSLNSQLKSQSDQYFLWDSWWLCLLQLQVCVQSWI